MGAAAAGAKGVVSELCAKSSDWDVSLFETEKKSVKVLLNVRKHAGLSRKSKSGG